MHEATRLVFSALVMLVSASATRRNRATFLPMFVFYRAVRLVVVMFDPFSPSFYQVALPHTLDCVFAVASSSTTPTIFFTKTCHSVAFRFLLYFQSCLAFLHCENLYIFNCTTSRSIGISQCFGKGE